MTVWEPAGATHAGAIRAMVAARPEGNHRASYCFGAPFVAFWVPFFACWLR